MAVDPKILNFLAADNADMFIYIHRTATEELAKEILTEGLEFYESLHNTTDVIINDPIHIQYWLKMRENYGIYTMVISFSRQIFFKYLELIKSHPDYAKMHIEVEQILSEKDVFINSNDDIIFTLSNHFIKGYFNSETLDIVENPVYDPYYDSPRFKQNLDQMVENYKLHHD